MTIRNIAEFLDPVIEYPGIPSEKHPEGRTYRVPSPDRKTGLRLAALAALGNRAARGEELSDEDVRKLDFDDAEEADFATHVLGAAHDEMVADGVADSTVKTIARDAFYVLTATPEVADLVLQGEALARDAARAATGPKTDGSSSSQASGATQGRTRSRASTRSSKSKKETA